MPFANNSSNRSAGNRRRRPETGRFEPDLWQQGDISKEREVGLTPIRPQGYWWVSQLGMLPATAIYVYAGSSDPTLSTLCGKEVTGILTPQWIVAFVLPAVFPLIAKRVMQRFRPVPA